MTPVTCVRFRALMAVCAAIVLTSTAPQAAPITMDMVTVGNPGNPNDTTGYGSVEYAYQIGKYPVTIGQYTAFLNAVAATDNYATYNSGMGTLLNIAGIQRDGSPGSYTYSVIGPSGTTPTGASSPGNRPITYVSWFDAARFANWMANGQPTGVQNSTTTENGAYDLNGATNGNAVAKNTTNPNTGAAPTFAIPTESEWCKAAYYQPTASGGPSDGYWAYATRSDSVPGNAIGSGANQANWKASYVYSVTQSTTLLDNQNYLTDVGAFTGSGSFYGTFDQSGNVFQLNDLDGTAGPTRGIRGGCWNSSPAAPLYDGISLSSSFRSTNDPSSEDFAVGFRLSAPIAVPEPSACAMALAGLACGGWHVFRAGRTRPAHGVRRSLVALLLVTCSLMAGSSQAAPITMDMVTVGNPGNANDTTGYGGVAYDYQIGKYDVTIGQYTAFLNAVAATDTYSLYNASMATNLNVAGISRAGSSGSYTYSVINNGGDSSNRPITYVSWFDAARFSNWMANGQPTGAQSSTTTENGAYNVNGATSGNAPARNVTNPNTGATPTYVIPRENDWYKAAYYSPVLNSGSGGYYTYATQSNSDPGNIIGAGANQANYYNGVYSVTQSSSYSGSQNYLSDVGATSGSGSFYGTFDQNGDVFQWNDLDGDSGSSRGRRGGCWDFDASFLSSASRFTYAPSFEIFDIGFRLAAPAAVPEPSTYAMALVGLACGGYSLYRRRKRA